MTPVESAPAWLFLAVFPMLWIAVSQLLATLGGWRDLAEHYGSDADFDGQKRRFCSASFRRASFLPVNYSSMLTIGVNARGLYLVPFILFRPGQRPLLIPFEDLTARKSQVFLFTVVTFTAARAPKPSFTLTAGLARWIANASHGILSDPLA